MKIKQTFLRWGIYAFPLLLTGCVADVGYYGGPEAAGPETEVILQLAVPGSALAQETDTTAPHEKIEDLIVIAFESTEGTAYVNGKQADEPYLYYKTATIRSQQGRVTQWTANVHTLEAAQTFVVIANADSHVTTDGEPLSDYIKNLLYNANSALNPDGQGSGDFSTKRALLSQIVAAAGGGGGKIDPDTPFLMYGESGPTKITVNNRTIEDFDVTRMVARVNITIDSGREQGDTIPIEGFTPKSVRFYNYYNKGCLLPSENPDAEPALPDGGAAPNNPDGSKPYLEYDFSEGKIIHDAIYLFEASNLSDENAMERGARPCLLVYGNWKGKDQYWRLDFIQNGAYKHLLRNHSYNITIVDVAGDGYEDPEDALNSVSAGMSATLVSWSEKNIAGIDISGNFFFGISKLQYAFGKPGTNSEIQQVTATKGAKWTATIPSSVNWITFESGDGYTLTNNRRTATGIGHGPDKATDLKFQVAAQPNGGTVREATMTFKLEEVLQNVKATITQDLTNPVFIDWDGKAIVYDELGNFREGCTVTFGPENVELSWRFTQGELNVAEGTIGTTPVTSGSEETSKEVQFNDKTCLSGVSLSNLSGTVGNFFTKEGTLTLIAKNINGEGADIINIPVRQVRYGVSFPNPLYVFPTQKTQPIKVLSNFAWECDGTWEPIIDPENPEDETIYELLKKNNTGGSGQPATEEEDASTMQLTTLANPDRHLNRTGYAKFTFTGAPWTINGDNPTADLKVTTGIFYNGHHWEYRLEGAMNFHDYLKLPAKKTETINNKEVEWSLPSNKEIVRLISTLEETKENRIWGPQLLELYVMTYSLGVGGSYNRDPFLWVYDNEEAYFTPVAECDFVKNGSIGRAPFIVIESTSLMGYKLGHVGFAWNRHTPPYETTPNIVDGNYSLEYYMKESLLSYPEGMVPINQTTLPTTGAWSSGWGTFGPAKDMKGYTWDTAWRVGYKIVLYLVDYACPCYVYPLN